ncbi:stxk [Lactobacillus psittaci DSM 15354]|uniref:Stxk n=1 Tax=Lactobacillus psittaci DSM 15354 TaxID=1122152 RepID=A0A0R1S017_9LACO|nr:stxk [Lactobacillus psittaci DSM 15354]
MAALIANIKSWWYWFFLPVITFSLSSIGSDSAFLFSIALFCSFLLSRIFQWRDFKTNFYKNILGILVAIGINEISDFSSFMLVFNFFKITLNERIINGWSIITIYSIFNLLICTLLLILFKKTILLRTVTLADQKTLLFEVGIFEITVILFSEIMKAYNVLGIARNVMFLFIIVQFMTSMFIINSNRKRQKEVAANIALSSQIKTMKIYLSEIEKNYQVIRKFKHDYKNLLLGLKISNDKSLDETYLNDLDSYSNQVLDQNISLFNDLANIKIESIKSLLLIKLIEARQKKIDTNFFCKKPLQNIPVRDVILVRVLGIVLDNAIEANEVIQDKKMTIGINQTESDINIVVKNHFSGNPLSLKPGESTKGANRGLGLSTLDNINKQTKNLDIKQYVENASFVTLITLKG